jgi:glycine betaine/proline transport system substrate-binding protein
VAKIILEKQGMTVKLTDIDENAAWPALDKGSIDANLEVWPSGHAKDIQTYITDKKSVVDGGLLGVTGQIGWFIPKFVADEHPGVQDLGRPEVPSRGRLLQDRRDR